MKILAILTFEHSLIFAYSLIGFVSLLAYAPQIRRLFKSKNAVTDISLQTWSVWCMDAVVSLLYAIFVLEDLLTSLIFGIDFLGAASIVGLVAKNKFKNGVYNIRSVRIAAVCNRFGEAAMRGKNSS